MYQASNTPLLTHEIFESRAELSDSILTEDPIPSEIQRKRRRASLLDTPRDSAGSLQRTHNVRYAGDFLQARFWRWLGEYLRTVLKGRDQFLEYDLSDPRAGIYTMPDSASVALASDWGAGTISAYRVRDQIVRR